MIICNRIVIPNKKPRFQKEFIWRGQGYDCKWDFISNTKYNFILLWSLLVVPHEHVPRRIMIVNQLSLGRGTGVGTYYKLEIEEEDQGEDERNVIL